MRLLSRILLGLLILVAGSCVACRVLLPERFAVNAPILSSAFGWGIGPPDEATVGSRIRAATGWTVSIYAPVEQARELEATASGDLLVSVPRQGKIVRLQRDGDGDGLPDGQSDLLTGLDRPHGLDVHDGWLYVAEGSAVFRVRFDEARGETSGTPEYLVRGLPDGGNHWTRTVGIGPDEAMYVTVGSSCNVCFEEDERRAAMLRFPRAGGEGTLYARGLRNAVGFAWRPGTDELYATDNGRDFLGDDFPPCELNRVVEGGDYGWPVANGDRRLDPDLGAGHEARAAASLPPAHGFGAHTAPLGITFLSADTALVALHGSWNRTEKDGYEVVSLHWEADGSLREREFLWGFLEDEDVIGRPVDVAVAPDGNVFVSDDFAGVIYRVGRGGSVPSAPTASMRSVGSALAHLPAEEREAVAAQGAGLYDGLACASCHDPERADPGVVPVALEHLGQRYDLPELERFLAAPTPPMPAFDVDAAERRALAVYLLSTHH